MTKSAQLTDSKRTSIQNWDGRGIRLRIAAGERLQDWDAEF